MRLAFTIPVGLGGIMTPLALTAYSPAARAISAVVVGLAATALT